MDDFPGLIEDAPQGHDGRGAVDPLDRALVPLDAGNGLGDGIAVRDIHGVGLDELLGLAGFLKALGVHVQRGNAVAAAGPTLGGEAPHATARARD